MKQIAMIKNGEITNIAIWDGIEAWHPGPDYALIEITDLSPKPGIGWTYDGTNFSPQTQINE